MNLTISGHHLEVTPALRGYVTQKLDRINRHFDQVVDVRVILSIEKQKEKEFQFHFRAINCAHSFWLITFSSLK